MKLALVVATLLALAAPARAAGVAYYNPDKVIGDCADFKTAIANGTPQQVAAQRLVERIKRLKGPVKKAHKLDSLLPVTDFADIAPAQDLTGEFVERLNRGEGVDVAGLQAQLDEAKRARDDAERRATAAEGKAAAPAPRVPTVVAPLKK